MMRLARLSTGLLVALFVFGSVSAAQGAVIPAAQSSVVPAAQSGSGLKVQDRSHDNDNPDNTLYALYQTINTGTASVSLEFADDAVLVHQRDSHRPTGIRV